jgi:hypothetical protein
MKQRERETLKEKMISQLEKLVSKLEKEKTEIEEKLSNEIQNKNKIIMELENKIFQMSSVDTHFLSYV